MLVVVSSGKLLVAGVVLVILGRHSMLAVLFFAAGILVVTGAVMVEAVFRLFAGLSHGRT